jgi:predicted RNA-binding protein (virulence factor B family)
MIEIGKTNNLVITKKVDFGVYLTDDEYSKEVLLPRKYVPKDANIGDSIDVFVHLDSEDRIIATAEIPFAEVGQVAHLKVTDLSNFGAFLDWGLTKELLVPFKEQRTPMLKDKSYSVFIFLDASGRISASSKLNRYLIEENNGEFYEDQKVDLQIASRSPIGYKAVINGTHLGLIHNSDLLQPIKLGLNISGYIRKIRDDGRIDLSLQKRGIDVVNDLADEIIAHISNENNIKLNDKASPKEIYDIFKVSKSNFKKAVGKLLSDKKIIIEANIIRPIS